MEWEDTAEWKWTDLRVVVQSGYDAWLHRGAGVFLLGLVGDEELDMVDAIFFGLVDHHLHVRVVKSLCHGFNLKGSSNIGVVTGKYFKPWISLKKSYEGFKLTIINGFPWIIRPYIQSDDNFHFALKCNIHKFDKSESHLY